MNKNSYDFFIEFSKGEFTSLQIINLQAFKEYSKRDEFIFEV